MTTIKSNPPHSKRSFAEFDEPNPLFPQPDPSLRQPGTTKRLRTEAVEAKQAAK
ncbi:hypothetical protein MMC17_009788, partial [Xylographa soralifera]|nr:hypothetical protein [Xylographa soralifera]